uniref:Uncharacterized protein n=1 Tax=Cucumis melo TaxID=3656 RepID=A0A9I9EJ79_CUCME
MDFFCFSKLSSKDFIHVSYVENSLITYEEFSIKLGAFQWQPQVYYKSLIQNEMSHLPSYWTTQHS